MKKTNDACGTDPGLVPEMVVLDAAPRPLGIDLKKTAVVMVDMQNAFLAKGGFLDLTGHNVDQCRAAIGPAIELCRAARANGCKVIYVFTVHHPGDAGGGPDSVHWHKENTLIHYREHPEHKDKLLLPDTWGAEIVPELAPEADDIRVEKPRYSGFWQTHLDTVLKRYGIKYLLTGGVATNACVEATIRDAYYHGYFPVLVSDAAATSGPAFLQEATIFNVVRAYGWVTSSASVLKVMRC